MDRWFSQMPLQGAEASDYKKLWITSEIKPGWPDPDKEDILMLARRRLSRIFWKRKFFDYPLSITYDTLSKFGLVDLILCGISYVTSKFKKYDMSNLEGFYKSRFGEKLYDRFFNAYTYKVRGKRPKDISSARGAQRVKWLNLGKAVRDYFKKMIIWDKQSTQTETSLIGKFYYPKLGPGQMWEVVADKVQALWWTIVFGADFVGGVITQNQNSNVSNIQEAQRVEWKRNHVCAIPVTKDGKILLQLRDMGAPMLAGLMSTFGGRVEEEESIFEWLQRELKEELEMKVTRDNVRYRWCRRIVANGIEIYDHMYEVFGFDDQTLHLHEWEKIMKLSFDEALQHEKIAQYAKENLESFLKQRNIQITIEDDLIITNAELEDVEDIEYVRKQSWIESYVSEASGVTAEMIQKKFERNSERNIADLQQKISTWKGLLVIKHRGKVVWLKYPPRFNGKLHKIWGIYILKEYIGKGLGTRLMQHSLKDVLHQDLYSEVVEYNQNAIAFYKKLGFEIDSSQEGEGTKFENGIAIKTVMMKRPGDLIKSKQSVQSVSYSKNWNTVTVESDIVVSTAPIKELMTRFEGADPEVARLSNLLEYRDFITVGILAKKLLVTNTSKYQTLNNIIPDNWLYIHDEGTTVGRIQVFNNRSPYLVADQNNVWIGLEYFCNKTDEIRNISDEEMIEFAIKELEKMQLLDRSQYLDGVVRRMEYTYPCYFGEWYDKFDTIKNYLDGIQNLYCVGRNGAHRYNNQDHSMLSSMRLADMLISWTIDRKELWSINTEEEYHEKK